MLLELKSIQKSFGGVQAVKDVSLKVEEGQIIGIIGPNGAGKTTVLNLISGIYPVDTGEVMFRDQNIAGMKQHKIARLGISRTFQNIRLFKGLTVLENVMTALDAATNYNIFSAILHLPSKHRLEKANREKALEALRLVGLEEHRDASPFNLPYGLQRRVELARAIVNEPRLLMLDEPAAGLNPSEIEEFIALILKLREKYGFGILFIEHRMKVVNELSEHIYVINFGDLLTEGDPEKVVNNPEVIKAYLGEEGGV